MAEYVPLCLSGVATVLCSTQSIAGVQATLYSLSGEAQSLCYESSNPHLSRVIEPVEFFSGIATPLKVPVANLSREKFADIETSMPRFLILSETLIPTGLWAIIGSVKGEIVSCDRSVSGVSTITVDTAKVIPFSVEN